MSYLRLMAVSPLKWDRAVDCLSSSGGACSCACWNFVRGVLRGTSSTFFQYEHTTYDVKLHSAQAKSALPCVAGQPYPCTDTRGRVLIMALLHLHLLLLLLLLLLLRPRPLRHGRVDELELATEEGHEL